MEREPAVARERDRQAGGGADRDQAADAGRERLLDQLVADPPAEDQARLGGRLPGEHPRPGDLVDGVVPPDVLAHDEQLARCGDERGRVDPAGAREEALTLAQGVGQPSYDLGGGQLARPRRGASGQGLSDAVGAADTAGRGAGREGLVLVGESRAGERRG